MASRNPYPDEQPYAQAQVPAHRPRKKSSGAGLGVIMVLFSLIFIVGPFAAPIKIDSLSRLILLGFGVLTLLIGSIILVITRLYMKASANEAFVKTGMGGRKAIIDGGAIVVPVVHEVIWVSLETMKLEIIKMAKDALLTMDKLRADIRAEFFIRVEKTQEGVLQAATSLGDRCSEPAAVKQLVEAKLVSALRVVAATMNLEDLNKNRDKFAEEVQKIVQNDIKHNGYMLETVTISHLDQAPKDTLDPENNVFDAEGARNMAAKIQVQLTEKTEIEQKQAVARVKLKAAAEQETKQREVEKNEFIFQQDVANTKAQQDTELQKKQIQAETARKTAEVEAENTAASEAVRAQKGREAQEAKIIAEQAVQLRNVAKEQAVQVANTVKEKEVQAAQIDRDTLIKTKTVEQQKDIETATVEKQKAVEVAKRNQEITIATKEQELAAAAAAKLTAEADRERANQAKLTVEKEGEAQRAKTVVVINKQAEAESRQIEQQTQVNVEAYRTTKLAEAEQLAAEKTATAVRTKAEADRDAKQMAAAGDQAVALVPVQVKQAEVDVEAKRVTVLKSELEAKTANEKMAFDLQVKLAEIAADRDVRMKAAESLGAALSGANMTIWGDQRTLEQISGAFYAGQQKGKFIEGVANATPADVKEAVFDSVERISGAVSNLAKNMFGKDISPDMIATLVNAELEKQRTGAPAAASAKA